MVDQLRIERLLRQIMDELSVLGAEREAPDRRQDDPMWMRGVKYSFITSIEGSVDVAQHLCATSGWGPPADNGDAMRILGVKKVLPLDVADGMRRAVGFRNVLVHEYTDVDDDVVLTRLHDHADLRRFVTHIAEYLATSTA